MQPVSRAGVAIVEFAGLLTNTGNIGNADTSQTLAVLINLACASFSEVRVRPGIRLVTFSEDDE